MGENGEGCDDGKGRQRRERKTTTRTMMMTRTMTIGWMSGVDVERRRRLGVRGGRTMSGRGFCWTDTAAAALE